MADISEKIVEDKKYWAARRILLRLEKPEKVSQALLSSGTWQSCCLLLSTQAWLFRAREPAAQWPFLIASSAAVAVNSPGSPLASSCSRLNQSLTWVHQTGCVLSTVKLQIWLFWVLPWGGQPHVSGEFLDLKIVFKSPEIINAYHPQARDLWQLQSQLPPVFRWATLRKSSQWKDESQPTCMWSLQPDRRLAESSQVSQLGYAPAGVQAGSAVWGHPCCFFSRSTQMVLLELRKYSYRCDHDTLRLDMFHPHREVTLKK